MLKSEMFERGKVFCKRSIGLCFLSVFSEHYGNVVTEQATIKKLETNNDNITLFSIR